MRKDRATTAWASLSALLLLAACSRPSQIRTSTALPTAAEPLGSSTPFQPVLVPTVITSGQPPTATPVLTPPSARDHAIRIELEPGAATSSATVTGDVGQLDVVRYVLRALAGTLTRLAALAGPFTALPV